MNIIYDDFEKLINMILKLFRIKDEDFLNYDNENITFNYTTDKLFDVINNVEKYNEFLSYYDFIYNVFEYYKFEFDMKNEPIDFKNIYLDDTNQYRIKILKSFIDHIKKKIRSDDYKYYFIKNYIFSSSEELNYQYIDFCIFHFYEKINDFDINDFGTYLLFVEKINIIQVPLFFQIYIENITKKINNKFKSDELISLCKKIKYVDFKYDIMILGDIISKKFLNCKSIEKDDCFELCTYIQPPKWKIWESGKCEMKEDIQKILFDTMCSNDSYRSRYELLIFIFHFYYGININIFNLSKKELYRYINIILNNFFKDLYSLEDINDKFNQPKIIFPENKYKLQLYKPIEIKKENNTGNIIEKITENINNEEKNCIEKSLTAPLSYQKYVVDFFNKSKKKGLIIDHPMGSGKTFLSVLISECFISKNELNKVIFIGPNILTKYFKKTVTDLYGNPDFDTYYTVYTYAKFYNQFEEMKELDLEIKFKNILLIVDEAHNFRNYTSEKTKFLIKISKYCKKILLLTGTPVYNSPSDVITLITMLNDNDYNDNKKKFKTIVNGDGTIKNKIDSDLFFECLFSMHILQKDENFPIVHYNNIMIEMTDDLYYEYKLIEFGMKNENIELDAKGTMTFYSGLRKFISGMDPEKNPKYKFILDELLKQRKNGYYYKSIVYSSFKDLGIGGIYEILKKNNFIVEEYTGDLSEKERLVLIEKYNNDEIDVLLITKAGGEGLDLKNTKNVFLVEIGWNFPSEDQVVARASRYKSHITLPQKERYVNVFRLIFTKPTPNKAKLIILKKLQDIAKTSKIDPKFKSFLLEKDESEKSVDVYLFELMNWKKNINTKFENDLIKYSIEKMNCTKYLHD